MTVLAHSLNGCLRIRAFKKYPREIGPTAVVELRSHLRPGEWTWCVWRSLELARAWELFHNQTIHHADPGSFGSPVVQPGV